MVIVARDDQSKKHVAVTAIDAFLEGGADAAARNGVRRPHHFDTPIVALGDAADDFDIDAGRLGRFHSVSERPVKRIGTYGDASELGGARHRRCILQALRNF